MGHIKRELTKIQILPQNASNLFEGQEKVPAVTKIIRFMTVGVDLFSVQADRNSVVSSSCLERQAALFTNCGSKVLAVVTVTN